MQVLTPEINDLWFGVLRVRSPLLAESRLMSLPAPTQIFQFRAFPSYSYLLPRTMAASFAAVLPHSEISGSTLICSSPKLIAAYHVLHRLLMPRHSPCALLCLTFVGGSLRLLGSNFKSWSNKIGSLTFELCRPYWRHLTVVQQNCKLP